LRNAGIEPFLGFPSNTYDKEVHMRHTKTAKRPEDWKTVEKLAAVLDALLFLMNNLVLFCAAKGFMKPRCTKGHCKPIPFRGRH
jgi:hypothetical protein